MIIVLLMFIIIGLGTIIKHLINLREQNEIIIEIFNDIYDAIYKDEK